MLKKTIVLAYTALILLLIACKGEKYDVSKAINILPDRSDALTQDFSLKDTPIRLEGPTYRGDLKYRNIIKLWGLSSNFEIIGEDIFYVSSNKKFIRIDAKGKKTIASFKDFLTKNRNVTSTVFSIYEKDALIVTNSGDIIKIDLPSMKVVWHTEVRDVLTIKPFMTSTEAVVPTSSGGVLIFDLQSGKLTNSVEKVEDPLGINFNSTIGLDPIKIDAGNLFISYYKNQLLFFDSTTKIKLYTFSLGRDVLDFSRFSSTPIFYGNAILSATDEGLSSLSLISGIKLWQINGNFKNNMLAASGFTFGFEADSCSIIAASIQAGDIKWKVRPCKEEKPQKAWFSLEYKGYLLFILEDGMVGKIKLSDGSLSVLKRHLNSPDFSYKLYDGKIYYTDKVNNLIVLE